MFKTIKYTVLNLSSLCLIGFSSLLLALPTVHDFWSNGALNPETSEAAQAMNQFVIDNTVTSVVKTESSKGFDSNRLLNTKLSASNSNNILKLYRVKTSDTMTHSTYYQYYRINGKDVIVSDAGITDHESNQANSISYITGKLVTGLDQTYVPAAITEEEAFLLAETDFKARHGVNNADIHFTRSPIREELYPDGTGEYQHAYILSLKVQSPNTVLLGGKAISSVVYVIHAETSTPTQIQNVIDPVNQLVSDNSAELLAAARNQAVHLAIQKNKKLLKHMMMPINRVKHQLPKLASHISSKLLGQYGPTEGQGLAGTGRDINKTLDDPGVYRYRIGSNIPLSYNRYDSKTNAWPTFGTTFPVTKDPGFVIFPNAPYDICEFMNDYPGFPGKTHVQINTPFPRIGGGDPSLEITFIFPPLQFTPLHYSFVATMTPPSFYPCDGTNPDHLNPPPAASSYSTQSDVGLVSLYQLVFNPPPPVLIFTQYFDTGAPLDYLNPETAGLPASNNPNVEYSPNNDIMFTIKAMFDLFNNQYGVDSFSVFDEFYVVSNLNFLDNTFPSVYPFARRFSAPVLGNIPFPVVKTYFGIPLGGDRSQYHGISYLVNNSFVLGMYKGKYSNFRYDLGIGVPSNQYTRTEHGAALTGMSLLTDITLASWKRTMYRPAGAPVDFYNFDWTVNRGQLKIDSFDFYYDKAISDMKNPADNIGTNWIDNFTDYVSPKEITIGSTGPIFKAFYLACKAWNTFPAQVSDETAKDNIVDVYGVFLEAFTDYWLTLPFELNDFAFRYDMGAVLQVAKDKYTKNSSQYRALSKAFRETGLQGAHAPILPDGSTV